MSRFSVESARKRIPRFLAAVVAVGALALTGCAAAQPTAAPSSSTSSKEVPATLTLGLATPGAGFAPIYYADAQGLFTKNDLTVKIVTFSGDADLVKAVLSGSVDVGVGSAAGMLIPVQEKQPVKAFFAGFNTTNYSWWGSPNIKTIKQGKGKKWGISTTGSTTDTLTRWLLKKNGMSASDVNIIAGGESAGRFAAAQAGQLDVNIFADPFNYVAKAAGFHELADLADYMKGYPSKVLWTTDSNLSSKKQALTQLTTAVSEGIQGTLDHPKIAANATVAANKSDPASTLESIEGYKKAKQLDPTGNLPATKDMNTFWQITLDSGTLSKRIPDKTWFDPSFLIK